MRKTLGALVAIVALSALCVCPAFASENAAPVQEESQTAKATMALTTQSAASSDLQAQATSKKTKVRILTSIGDYKYAYNSKGQLTRITGPYNKVTFKYAGTKLVSVKTHQTIYSDPENIVTARIKYNKKGQISKEIKTKKSSKVVYTKKYSYDKKGRISKAVDSNSVEGKTLVTTYKYGKNNRKVKVTEKDVLNNLRNGSYTLKYNKKGYLVEQSGHPYRITYDSAGKIKTRIDLSGKKQTYKYKTVSVPANYAKSVKDMQIRLANAPQGILPD